MILQKIEIEQFGGLKDYTLHLTPGFQYLYGENEVGKSTVCAFLAVMFYGLPPKKSKEGLKGDSRRFYMPWGEKYMAGMVTFSDEGKNYVLKRRFGQTARGDSCTLYRAEDWSEIPIEPDEIGQRFFGVGEDAFRKSLFIGQSGAAFSKGKDDELITRLSNLEHTGDEDASVQKAIEILQEAEHNLVTKTGRGGAILQLDRDIEDLEAELMAAKQKHSSFQSLLEEIRQLTAERDAVSREIINKEAMHEKAKAFASFAINQKQREQRQALIEGLEKEKHTLKQTEEKLAEFRSQLVQYAAVASMSSEDVFKLAEKESLCERLLEKEKKLKDMVAEREALQEQIKNAEEKTKKRVNKPLLYAAVVLCILGIGAGFFFLPALTLLVVGAVLIGLSFLESKEARLAKQELAVLGARLLEKLQEEDSLHKENIPQQLKQYQNEIAFVLQQTEVENLRALNKKIEESQTIKRTEETLKTEKARLEASVQRMEKSLADMPEIAEEPAVLYEGPPAEEVAGQIKQLQMRQIETERRLAQLTAKVEEGFSGTRGVSIIESEIADAKEKRAEMTERYETLRLARETMEQCAEELKSSFAPVLNEKSGAIISRLTAGRYSEVKVTDDYKMMLKTPDGHEIIESDYVSAGTCDLLYFALRLAVLETLYENIPLLIMDDTFLQMDKHRQQAAFRFLQENPAGQIIYFSCHEPQPELLIKVNKMS